MQLCTVQVGDALGGIIAGCHGDKAVAPRPRSASIGYHLRTNHLAELGESLQYTNLLDQRERT